MRRLPAVETLGSVSVLATDKTGTLTEGRMVVQHVWTPRVTAELPGVGYEPEDEALIAGRPAEPDELEPLTELLTVAALCNDATLRPADDRASDGRWTALGDPMEAALLAAAAKTRCPGPAELSATAPGSVKRPSTASADAARGYRALAVASGARNVPSPVTTAESRLGLLGLVALSDPSASPWAHAARRSPGRPADLVLTDDELSTVVAAVEEGRRVYDNIRRFLVYGMAGGAAEILVMLTGPLLGLPLPLRAGRILWINLLTHGLTGVAMGAEPAAPGSDVPPAAPT